MRIMRPVTRPSTAAVSVEDAKMFMNIEASWTHDDDLIEAMTWAATEHAEDFTRRRLVTQSWDLVLDVWPNNPWIVFPYGNLRSVSYLSWTDDAGNAHTIDPQSYVVSQSSTTGRLVLRPNQSWPSAALWTADPIVARFECGYGQQTDIPKSIQHAIKILVASMYAAREEFVAGVGVTHLKTPDLMLWPYRLIGFGGGAQ